MLVAMVSSVICRGAKLNREVSGVLSISDMLPLLCHINGKNINFAKAFEVHSSTDRKKSKCCLRCRHAAFTVKSAIQFLPECVQIKHIIGRIGLLFRESVSAPQSDDCCCFGSQCCKSPAPARSARGGQYRCGSVSMRSWCNKRGRNRPDPMASAARSKRA